MMSRGVRLPLRLILGVQQPLGGGAVFGRQRIIFSGLVVLVPVSVPATERAIKALFGTDLRGGTAVS